jgi:O-antigen/teichoic acid export membrane protein
LSKTDDSSARAGVLILGASKILAQAAPILLLAWFSKSITPEELGVLSFIVATLSVLALLSDLGLSDAQNRYLHDSPGLLAPLVNRELALAAGAGVIVYVSDLITGWAAHHGLLLGLAVFASSFYVIVAGFSGLYRLKTAGFLHGVSAIAFIGGAILLGWMGVGVVNAVLGARLLSWALLDLPLLAVFRREGRWRAAWKIPREVWVFAMSAFWFSAVELAINQVDVVLVRAMLGDRQAGIFKTAALLGVAPMAMGTLVAAALLPMLVRLHARSPQEARKLVRSLSLALGAGLLALFIGGVFSGRFLLELFFTDLVAREGFPVFLFSLGATACYVVAMPVQEWLLATDQAGFVRKVATLRAAVFFPLAAWGAWRWGITGVAAAHLAIYAFFMILYGWRFLSHPTSPVGARGNPR